MVIMAFPIFLSDIGLSEGRVVMMTFCRTSVLQVVQGTTCLLSGIVLLW